MNPLTAGALGFAAVLLLAAARMPLALALGVVGAVGTGILMGVQTFYFVVGVTPIEVLNSYGLSVIPLFILMGALAVSTGLAKDLVNAANAFLRHYRGGLAMGSVASCALFGALSGSNIATLSTMSKITVPEMLRRGYSRKLAAGTLASASTLDILIPPSVPMVIYATLTETSVGRMFAGGMVPGLILTLMFIVTIYVWAVIRPAEAPRAERIPFRQRLPYLKGVWGVVAVFGLMMGGMYAGYFSPTEAASVGAAGILVVAAIQKRMTWRGLRDSIVEAVHISTIIFLILIGVAMFHFFMESVGFQKEVAEMIRSLPLSPIAIMGVILVVLILLGCFMDALTILFITVPFLHPIVKALGFDSIWFGVVMVMVVQLGLIHPPFGLNVFILSSMIKEVRVGEAFWGCVPFVVATLVLIVVVTIYPGIITWLPNLMFGAK